MPADTQTIIDAAQKVADLLADHPAVEKYKQAQKSLQDDPDASSLLKEFNSVLTQISHNERAGLPPTEQQRKQFEGLQTQIASHLKFKAYSMAEYELTDLLRKISQTWQKPLARPGAGGAGDAQARGPQLTI
ncbi:MAG: YlbF family regulator [Burkholderiales bacterium]|nr:YlbF family regulator [Phycisphaerae bacterium]